MCSICSCVATGSTGIAFSFVCRKECVKCFSVVFPWMVILFLSFSAVQYTHNKLSCLRFSQYSLVPAIDTLPWKVFDDNVKP